MERWRVLCSIAPENLVRRIAPVEIDRRPVGTDIIWVGLVRTMAVLVWVAPIRVSGGPIGNDRGGEFWFRKNMVLIFGEVLQVG